MISRMLAVAIVWIAQLWFLIDNVRTGKHGALPYAFFVFAVGALVLVLYVIVQARHEELARRRAYLDEFKVQRALEIAREMFPGATITFDKRSGFMTVQTRGNIDEVQISGTVSI